MQNTIVAPPFRLWPPLASLEPAMHHERNLIDVLTQGVSTLDVEILIDAAGDRKLVG